MSLAVRHWPIHNQSRPLVSGGVAFGGDLLVRSGKGEGLGDKVLFARAQTEHVSVSATAEKLIESVGDGVSGVRALARHDCPSK